MRTQSSARGSGRGRRRLPMPAVAGLVAAVGLAAVVTASLTASAASTTLYVATTGSDSAAGTLAAPLKTIQKAIDLAAAGTTIQVRGGTYAPTANITIAKSGTASSPITLTAYNGETVVIDAEGMPYTPGALDSTIPTKNRGAIHLTGSYWRITGLQITHGAYGIYADGASHNVFTRLVTHDNYETGFQLQGASADNQVIALDSYGNHDPRKAGESADGIGIKQGSGAGNVIDGARLWNNADDGLDFWMFETAITVKNTISYGNGYNRWNISGYSGDGNGFKLGGAASNDPDAPHVVSNTIAWGNSASGYTNNGNPGAIAVDHSTAWKNGKTGFSFAGSKGRLTKNIAVGNTTAYSLGTGSVSGNSWNIGGTWTFVSTSTSTITGARTSTGAIASSSFLVPSNGKDAGARF